MGDSDFKIDLTETFPHLNNAPIVEAVIEVRTRAEAPWEQAAVTQRLKGQLPEYPNVLSINAAQQEFTFGPKVAASATHQLGWSGLRFQSADKLHVAEFKRDGFLFLRLRPYETWETLESEARRYGRCTSKLRGRHKRNASACASLTGFRCRLTQQDSKNTSNLIQKLRADWTSRISIFSIGKPSWFRAMTMGLTLHALYIFPGPNRGRCWHHSRHRRLHDARISAR